MNDYSIILAISDLTEQWKLSDWVRFRSYNDYWMVKNIYHKKWYNKKTGRWSYNVYSGWLAWKLEKLQEYIADNQ